MFWNCLAVGAGGALGAAGRYLLGLLPWKGAFPLVTFCINVLGAFAIGVIAAWALGRSGVSPRTVLFLKTGLCGGFTTFSTYSLEGMQLLEKGQGVTALLYLGGSVLAGLLAVALGLWLGGVLAMD